MDAIDLLINQSQALDEHKHDYTTRAADLRFNNQARMVVPSNSLFTQATSIPLTPTKWAWNQIAAKLGPAVYGQGSNKALPVDYLLAIPPDLLAGNLNRHLQNSNGSKWFVRGFDDQARAVLSQNYVPISNTLVLSKFAEGLTQAQTPDFQVIRPYLDGDQLHLKTVWKNVDVPGHGPYGWGAYIGNGETGNAQLVIRCLIQRGVCENTTIVDTEHSLEARHVGDLNYRLNQMFYAIHHVLQIGAEWLQKQIQAELMPLPNFEATLNNIAAQYGWDDKTKTTFVLGTEGKETIGGLVNGLTWVAKTLPADEEVRIETLAGNWLKRVQLVNAEV